MAELKWYVVRAISGKEKKVKMYLDSEIEREGLQEAVADVLIPSEKVYEMRNGKKRVREKNFFPGYILVNVDLAHGEVEHVIRNIPGVLGFLGAEKASIKPMPLRPAEVNRILGKVDEAEEMGEVLDMVFFVGEIVKVMDGPFNGFEGVVEEVFEEKKKLNVTVKIFGRNTPVELNYVQVEKEH